MTSKLTRERLQEIAEDGFLKHGESKELARMALGAMESEPYWWAIENRHGDARFVEGEHTENNILDEVHELNEKDDNGEYFDGDAPYKAVPVYRSPVVAAHEEEPVAWRWRSGPDKRWHLTNRGDLAGEVEPLYRHAKPAPELKPVGYLFVSDQGAVAYSPTNWGMPGFRLIGQIYGDMSVELPAAPQEVNHG
ncbi:hypothetical protein PT375_03365 [Klebsiella variicola]|uniref:hypothetical protein n=1 Tax=Klebsiella variicola TaxID=244366 RepID=UPI0023F8AC4D|nr:hypothetical protein [Klebsiella variicola]MDF7652878.1 hypothetical protein [Klebsiella variicola]